jgi:hypothetical protein
LKIIDKESINVDFIEFVLIKNNSTADMFSGLLNLDSPQKATLIMKKFPLALILFSFFNQIFGQNYIEYHRTFNRIDEDIIIHDYDKAINRLDSIYSFYEFVYAKHCVKALQICVEAKDSLKADLWLNKCFKQGVPLWLIKTNKITQKSLALTTTINTVMQFDSLHGIYLSSIDTILKKQIDSILLIDQRYTRRVNEGFILFLPFNWVRWGIHNQRQLIFCKDIISKYGYPEEKSIGLPTIEDSTKYANYLSFWGVSELRNSKMQIILQHCFSSWHKIDLEFLNTLNENIRIGNLPPFQYAIISDFMLPNKPSFAMKKYGIRMKNVNENNLEIINKNRLSIGLNSIEQEKRNMLIERERRKNKKANSEIMLE